MKTHSIGVTYNLDASIASNLLPNPAFLPHITQHEHKHLIESLYECKKRIEKLTLSFRPSCQNERKRKWERNTRNK